MINKKILFLYSFGNRNKYLNDCRIGILPDTPLFGLNHLLDMGIRADALSPARFFSGKLDAICLFFLGRNYYVYFIFIKIFKYDYVFSSHGLNLLFLKSFFIFSPKWIIFNINLTSILDVNKNNKLKYFLILKSLKSAYKIVCLSNQQRFFLMNLGIPENKLVFIPFGVDKKYFNVTDSIEGDYILSVGRDFGRDYRTLIDAFRGINDKLIIVCSSYNIDKDISIPSNVTILYDLNYYEMKEMYKKSKFVVISSKKDGYDYGSDCSGQTSIMDAMACGKAVVATHRKWIDDYFIDKKDIFIVKPSDIGDLRRALILLSSDNDLRKSIANNGRVAIETKYNSQKMAKNLNILFNYD